MYEAAVWMRKVGDEAKVGVALRGSVCVLCMRRRRGGAESGGDAGCAAVVVDVGLVVGKKRYMRLGCAQTLVPAGPYIDYLTLCSIAAS